MVQILQIDGSEVHIEKMARLYKKVWNSEESTLKDRFLRHATYEGYKGLVVLNDEEEIVGFSYGYTSLPGQYYNGLLAKELSADAKQKWLSDCFEFVELAIHPSYRKQGFGRLLVTKLLEGIRNKTTVLTTQVNNHDARRLYVYVNWEVIKEPFYPLDRDNPYVIMGKELNM